MHADTGLLGNAVLQKRLRGGVSRAMLVEKHGKLAC